MEDLPELERRCHNCDGNGHCDYKGEKRCTWCGGSGWITTEAGDRVLDLMRHNFKAMLKETVE